MKRPDASTIFLAIATAVIMFGTRAIPTTEEKNRVLHLSAPIECPDSVQFSWTGGDAAATYSIYRRMHGDTYWERIAMNLTGVSGTTFVQGFTLDRDYDYEIRAD